MSISCFSAVKYVTLAAIFAFPFKNAFAAQNDFHPNCDMRSLSLDSAQQKQLRQIRTEHRKNTEQARKKGRTESASRKQQLVQVLAVSPFNKNEARRYLQQRYDSDLDLAIEELAVQHKIYQVLSPRQRDTWISNCAR